MFLSEGKSDRSSGLVHRPSTLLACLAFQSRYEDWRGWLSDMPHPGIADEDEGVFTHMLGKVTANPDRVYRTVTEAYHWQAPARITRNVSDSH